MDLINLDDLHKKLANRMKGCDDFVERHLEFDKTRVLICFMKGLTDREHISERLIKPMIAEFSANKDFDGNFDNLLHSVANKTPESTEDMLDSVLAGDCLIAVENAGVLYTVLCAVQVTVGRSIDEPTSDVTVKGPKAGFVEDAETNVTEIRRYIRKPELKFVMLKAGRLTSTKLFIAYIDGRADIEVVDKIKKQLEKIDATGIVDSGNIEMLLTGRKNSLFPIFGSSEKVDKVVSKLLSGRVAVIVDGSPFVLTAPYVFAECIQSAEDYLRSPLYATFIRALRFMALLISVYLPSFLVAVMTSHNELLPETLLKTIEELREGLPFSIFWEVLIVLIIFEMLREVGVRMPKTVGDAIGIVGSLILGDAAVQAGIASTVVIMVVAVSAICAFIVPVYMYSTVLLRFAFLFLGFHLGFYGIIMGTLVLLLYLSGMESYGAPYLSPLSPPDKMGMEDFVLAIPWKTLGRKERLDIDKSNKEA